MDIRNNWFSSMYSPCIDHAVFHSAKDPVLWPWMPWQCFPWSARYDALSKWNDSIEWGCVSNNLPHKGKCILTPAFGCMVNYFCSDLDKPIHNGDMSDYLSVCRIDQSTACHPLIYEGLYPKPSPCEVMKNNSNSSSPWVQMRTMSSRNLLSDISIYELIFKIRHEHICQTRGYFSAHGCASDM